MKNKLVKKLVSSAVAACLLLSSFGMAFGATAAAAAPADIEGHWAQSQVSEWIGKGLITGYEDGSFKPENQITRAEFITLVNRAFGFTEQTEISFSDVPSTNWAYADIAKAVKAGYISGYADGTIGAFKPISRQEAAVIVIRLLKINPASSTTAAAFTDANQFASWSKDAIGAVVAEEIMKGYSADNTFKPAAFITRAEAVVTLNRAMESQATVYDTAGTYGPATGVETVNKDVVVSTGGVTLQNMVINGDLLLGEGIGNGDAFLNNVKVTGTVTVQGGGENSIHFNDSVLIDIVIDKKSGTGTVRIVSEGSTTVALVMINSSAIIQESGSATGFGNVNVNAALPAGSKVTLQGSFNTVNVSAQQIQVDLPTGTVQQLNVQSGATGSTVNLGQASRINTLVLDTVVKMLGQGTIVLATINTGGAGTTFENPPATPAPTATTTTGSSTTAPSTATPTPSATPTATATPEPSATATPEPTATPAPQAPTASDVFISGTATVGETLTGNYTYQDADGDLEEGTAYEWYRSDDENGSNDTQIDGANDSTYVLSEEDAGYYITFEVTPANAAEPTIGDTVKSAATGAVKNAPVAPYVEGVQVTGMLAVGQTLTGNYYYWDTDGDAEEGTTYQWYRSDDYEQTINYTAIDGATSLTYVLGSEDAGKYITFEVTPKNAAAPTTGQAAKAVSQESVMGQPVISVDGSYSNHLPMITIGELTAGSVVTVYDTDGTTILASGTATTDTLTLALNALAPGTHTITAHAADSLREASLDSEELEYEVNEIAILPQNHFSLGSNHAIVLDAIGQVLTWGANWNAQIGNGTTTASPSRFTVPNLPSDIIAVQAGFGHSLILTSKGDVWQWGRGSNNTPVKVNGIDHAIAISAEGGTNSLVLKSDGTVWTWGDYTPLVQVPGLDHVLEIQARYASSYVLKADGTVWAWGDNTNGQLGNGTTTSSNVPVQVSGLTNIVSMKMGNQHALALSVTGSVYAWGFNQMGQVGNGTNANQLVPVELEDLPKITLLGAGNYQSFAQDEAGNVYAWGSNQSGKLGFGHTNNTNTPGIVGGISNVIAINGGGSNTTYALKADGSLWAWGDGADGMLGEGGSGERYTPGIVNNLNLLIAP